MAKLDLIFQALSDETRRDILVRLSSAWLENELLTVNEIAEPYAMSLAAVSKHLKTLEKAGLIIRGRDKQFRPISINYNAFRDIDQFLSGFRRGASLHARRLSQLGADEMVIRRK